MVTTPRCRSAGEFGDARKDPFAEGTLHGAIADVEGIDERITKHAEHWKIPRMSRSTRSSNRQGAFRRRAGAFSSLGVPDAVRRELVKAAG